jgi:hypothetical protein
MPCYTNNIATVEFGKNTDLDLLALAMKEIGETVYSRTATTLDAYAVRFKDGKLEYDADNFTLAQVANLKRAYSEQVITQTAKRNGWQLSWSVNASGNRQAEVLRVSR